MAASGDAGTAGDPFAALGDPEPAAASSSSSPRARVSVAGPGGRAADQPAGRLPPPPPAQAGGPGHRGGGGDAAHLPAPRRRGRRRRGLRPRDLGRRRRPLPAYRREHHAPTDADDRAPARQLRGGLRPRTRLRHLDPPLRRVVAGRAHRLRRPAGRVVLEPWLGGRIFERTPDGAEIDWGEITAWEPPGRLAYLWHIRRDRADATDVEITFVPLGDGDAPASTSSTPVGAPRRRGPGVAGRQRRRLERPAPPLRRGLRPPPTHEKEHAHDRGTGAGTEDDPGCCGHAERGSEFQAYRDESPTRRPSWSRSARPSCATTCAASTTSRMLAGRGDWVPLGNADEQKPAAAGRSRPGRARTTTPSGAGTA